MKTICVKDGETFSVITEVEPSFWDPSGKYKAVANYFRATANAFAPLIVITALKPEPTLLSVETFKKMCNFEGVNYIIPRNKS